MDPLDRNNVTIAGNPNAAETIVFVNGLGTDRSCWSTVAAAFEADFRLVLFDNVGTDQSNQPYFLSNQFRYLNVSGYATDLLEICSALKLSEDTILIGHSIGALAGLLASIERPRQFKRLIMIGASPRYANTDDYQGGFSKEDINATYHALHQNYHEWAKSLAVMAMDNPDQPSLARRFAESITRIPQAMMLTILCSILQTDHRADLGKVCIPTLLIQSQDDYFVPQGVAEYMQASIPDCQLAMIDARGHLPHLSAPEKVIPALRRFIGKKRPADL